MQHRVYHAFPGGHVKTGTSLSVSAMIVLLMLLTNPPTKGCAQAGTFTEDLVCGEQGVWHARYRDEADNIHETFWNQDYSWLETHYGPTLSSFRYSSNSWCELGHWYGMEQTATNNPYHPDYDEHWEHAYNELSNLFTVCNVMPPNAC